MGTKAWYQDREAITAILTALLGLYTALRQSIPALPEISAEVIGSIVIILGAVGFFGRSTDQTKPKLGLKTTRRQQ